MSAFSGSYGKGAMKRHRDLKRAQAAVRDSRTAPERRSRKGQRKPAGERS